MKHLKYVYSLFLFILGVSLSSCEIDTLINPNNPSIDLVNDATPAEIQNLLSGAESGMRNGLNTYYSVVGVIGREYYRISNSDPRFTTDLLGQGSAVLDNNTFYLTIPFAERYRTIKNTNLLIEAVEKTSSDLNDTQRKHILGIARTIQAHELLMVLNMLYSNGIRVDVADPDNLGPFLGLNESLTAIRNLLNQAATDLSTAGETEFRVLLSSGFEGFDTPETFLEFNRALAARVAVYQQDWAGALSLLDDSFLDLDDDLSTGTYYVFSTSGGDITNPIFYPPNANGELLAVHPSHIPDSENGDTRIPNQTSLRNNTVTQANLSSDYDLFVYKSQSSPIPIIRNAELILIYAEAKIQNNELADAVTALNVIRNAAGLPDYSGTVDQPSLITEMLNQRRYELYAEGHRWIDMRRYNRLAELPIDRPGDDVWELFPIPATEEGF